MFTFLRILGLINTSEIPVFFLLMLDVKNQDKEIDFDNIFYLDI